MRPERLLTLPGPRRTAPMTVSTISRSRKNIWAGTIMAVTIITAGMDTIMATTTITTT